MSAGGHALLNLAQHKVDVFVAHQVRGALERGRRSMHPIELDAAPYPRLHLLAGTHVGPKGCCCSHTRGVKDACVRGAQSCAAAREKWHASGGRLQATLLSPPPRP